MSKTLIIVAHPTLATSRANRTIVEQLEKSTNYTIHKLYDAYPNRRINVEREHELLLTHEKIVLLFPVYWYSSPSLLKEWQDAILTHNFAYGSHGNALANKKIMLCCTNGTSKADYDALDHGKTSLLDLLKPFEWTFKYCKMDYIEPFIIYSAGSLDENELIAKTMELIVGIGEFRD